jgi:hypothetical protein
MVNLYLIGTHHMDIRGPERLEKLLGFIRPDCLGVESTPENAQRRISDHADFLRSSSIARRYLASQHGAKQASNIINFLNSNSYEVWLAEQYFKQNKGSNLLWLDEYDPTQFEEARKEAFGNIADDKNDLKLDFIEELAKEDFEALTKKIDASYMDCSLEGIKRDPKLFKSLLLDRDEKVERKIRDAIINSKHSFVYIGGTMHFFGDYANLYERLKDLSPIRLRLTEADKF